MKVIELVTNDVTSGFTNVIINAVYEDLLENHENIEKHIDSTNGDIYLSKKEAAIFTKMIQPLGLCEKCLIGVFLSERHPSILEDMTIESVYNENPICIGCVMNTLRNLTQQLFEAIVDITIDGDDDKSLVKINFTEYYPYLPDGCDNGNENPFAN